MIVKILFALILSVTVWGNIMKYSNSSISISTQIHKEEKSIDETFRFSKDVIIDTYSLEENENGNVRIELNDEGLAEEVFFYGIDMPEVIRNYKKWRK